jgi:hypothetical protein
VHAVPATQSALEEHLLVTQYPWGQPKSISDTHSPACGHSDATAQESPTLRPGLRHSPTALPDTGKQVVPGGQPVLSRHPGTHTDGRKKPSGRHT